MSDVLKLKLSVPSLAESRCGWKVRALSKASRGVMDDSSSSAPPASTATASSASATGAASGMASSITAMFTDLDSTAPLAEP